MSALRHDRDDFAVILAGPTASGKTDLAFSLARHFPVECISVDAAQVYRGMDIGTAKPSPDLRAQLRHHLIDIREPDEVYSAAQFRTDAFRLIKEIRGRGKIPLLVGGTMFYFSVLESEPQALPAADPVLREEIETQAKRLGWPALHRRLASLDPARAAMIEPNDRQRIQRALEIVSIRGRPTPLPQQRASPSQGMRFLKLVLSLSNRAVLHRRIENRFEVMLEQGLVEEVSALLQSRDLPPGLPSMRTVGYRQVVSYLNGEVEFSRMKASAIVATRQLAKRQLTWLRHGRGNVWFDAGEANLSNIVIRYLSSALDERRIGNFPA